MNAKAFLKVLAVAAAAGAIQGTVNVIPEPYQSIILVVLAYLLPTPLVPKKNAAPQR